MSKTGSIAFCPFLVTCFFYISRTSVQNTVIVDDDFGSIQVTFAWHQDISPCIFQHRNQERQYITLCVQVFYCLENTCTLPFPTVEFRLEIPTMTLPHGDVTIVQSIRRNIRSRDVTYQRFGFLRSEYLGFFVFLATQCLWNQFLYFTLVGADFQLISFEFRRQYVGNSLIDFGYIVFTEREVGPIHIGKQLQLFSIECYRINLDTTHSDLLLGHIVQITANFLADVL